MCQLVKTINFIVLARDFIVRQMRNRAPFSDDLLSPGYCSQPPLKLRISRLSLNGLLTHLFPGCEVACRFVETPTRPTIVHPADNIVMIIPPPNWSFAQPLNESSTPQ
jgi:hypothetical protein